MNQFLYRGAQCLGSLVSGGDGVEATLDFAWVCNVESGGRVTYFEKLR